MRYFIKLLNYAILFLLFAIINIKAEDNHYPFIILNNMEDSEISDNDLLQDFAAESIPKDSFIFSLDTSYVNLAELKNRIDSKYKLFKMELFNPFIYCKKNDENEFKSFSFFYYYSDSLYMSVYGQIKTLVVDKDTLNALNKMLEKDSFLVVFKLFNIREEINSNLYFLSAYPSFNKFNEMNFHYNYFPEIHAETKKGFLKKMGKTEVDYLSIFDRKFKDLEELLIFLDSNKYTYELHQSYKNEPSILRWIKPADLNVFIKESDSSFIDLRLKYPNTKIDTNQTIDSIKNLTKKIKDFELVVFRTKINEVLNYYLHKTGIFENYMKNRKSNTILTKYPYNRDYEMLFKYYKTTLFEKLTFPKN